MGINRLRSLPAEIAQLKNLTTLNLSYNQFSSVPPEIISLKNLTKLYLDYNQLTVVPSLKNMPNLNLLDLSKNLIVELPREIVDSGMEVNWKWESGMNGIFLADNPLDSPPIEIVKQGIEAVKNYFMTIETEEVSRVYEAKLLIVGEGGVGKTSLMKRLISPDGAIHVNELTTHGIETNRWFIETPQTMNFRVNFWDFGGQEIYHATHQFFLTKRSLYLFVWAARTDDDLTSFDYWLNVVRLLSGNSPVIVVLNKIDERITTIDEHAIQAKFDNIVCFNKVSAMEGTGIKQLITKIQHEIAKLPHVGDVLPTVWVDIRRKLEGLDRNYISFDEYKAICKELGLDEEKAEFLSRYYHDLGIILHFTDNPILREIIFLRPDWATNAVYKVVDTPQIQNNNGQFHFVDLEIIWKGYAEDKFAHLLELMKRFELCFQIPVSQTYIVPELLRPSKPDFEWNYVNNLRFEYRYDFMPSGIITRFIVRTHDIIKGCFYWKNGVILERENTEALVISDRIRRRISIWVSGDKHRELLAIIRREFDYIHKTLNNPDVKEMIPCICSQCVMDRKPYFYDYETLCRFRKKKSKRAKGEWEERTIRSVIPCGKSTEDVSIEKLLGDYERPEDKEKMERLQIEPPIRVEISPHIEVSPTIEQKSATEQNVMIDLFALAEKLEDIRKQIRSQSNDSLEADVAVGEIAKAQKAAKEGDYSRVTEHLKAAGKWAFDFASSVGSSLVAEAIKKSMGM